MDMIYWIGRVFTIISVTAAADVKRTTFKLTSLPYHSSIPIDNPRESNSSIECIRMCISEYTNCLSATYNIKTRACTPGSRITLATQGSTRDVNDLLFYTEFCNTTADLHLYVYETVIQCLYVSTNRVTFRDARQICKSKGAILYLVKFNDKLHVLRTIVQYLTQGATWIGLSDLVREGRFVWEDNASVSKSSYPVPWRKYQPDNAYGQEDCVEMGTANDYMYLNDARCLSLFNFICEATSVK